MPNGLGPEMMPIWSSCRKTHMAGSRLVSGRSQAARSLTDSSVIQVRIDQGLVVKIGCPMRFSSDNQEEKAGKGFNYFLHIQAEVQ